MKNKWRKLLAAFCAASLFMTLPGMSVYSADLNDEDIIESVESVTDEVVKAEAIMEEDAAFAEVEALYPEDIEEAEVLPEEFDLPADDTPLIEESVGTDTYLVGDFVYATYDSNRGSIVLKTQTGGTLWPDWLRRAGIYRSDVKSITVLTQPFSDTYKKVKLPANSCGAEDEEYFVFGGLENLETLDLTGFDTSNVTDMSNMFTRCSSLTTLDLSGFNTAKVTDMSAMFSKCSSLRTLNLGSFNTSNVVSMSLMFSDCTSLTSVDVSSFNTSKVTGMQGMFQNCRNLKSLDLTGFNTSKVKYLSYMFENCQSLTTLRLISFKTPNISYTDEMFTGCTKLKYLDLGSFDMSKGVAAQNMFDGCNALDILITPQYRKITSNCYLPYTMYDRNGKAYSQLPVNVDSMVLGRTKALAASIFIDVRDPSHPYYNAIYWAAEQEITKGYSDGTFGIDRSCTRGEMVMFLWRYAGKPKVIRTFRSPFKDVPTTHTFYIAILWASQQGITKGYSDGTFGVDRNVTRGESMMFLWRLKGKQEPIPALNSPFSDVPKTHPFYKAILWGYQQHITTGYKSGPKKGTFGVDENCTRGQIVTFLYRAKDL